MGFVSYENGSESPKLDTLMRLLYGQGLTLYDLQEVLDESHGRPVNKSLALRLSRLERELS